MKTPTTRKGKDRPTDLPAGGDDSLPGPVEITFEQDLQYGAGILPATAFGLKKTAIDPRPRKGRICRTVIAKRPAEYRRKKALQAGRSRHGIST